MCVKLVWLGVDLNFQKVFTEIKEEGRYQCQPFPIPKQANVKYNCKVTNPKRLLVAWRLALGVLVGNTVAVECCFS